MANSCVIVTRKMAIMIQIKYSVSLSSQLKMMPPAWYYIKG